MARQAYFLSMVGNNIKINAFNWATHENINLTKKILIE
jgi:hypothetical protein